MRPTLVFSALGWLTQLSACVYLETSSKFNGSCVTVEIILG